MEKMRPRSGTDLALTFLSIKVKAGANRRLNVDL